MNMAVMTLSLEGFGVSRRVIAGLDVPADIFLPPPLYETGAKEFSAGIGSLTALIFSQYQNLVYIMPLGVVTRSIAPHIRDKHTDPAVVVVDVAGRYVISLLSGHEGGANALAMSVSNILRTDAVITTSTEAVKDLIVGVGCRKGTSSGTIAEAVRETLTLHQLSLDRVRLLSTVDIKSEEDGILRCAELLGVPLKIISSEEINCCIKKYNRSEFVAGKVGLEGVCEPTALLAGRKTQLLIEKTKYPGVTVAVARENFTW